MSRKARGALGGAVVAGILGCIAAGVSVGEERGVQGWTRGKGWGRVWGKDDERGALNFMTDATRLEALSHAKKGKVYDLGVPYDRSSFKWPGHSPCEVMSFRSPEGVKRQGGGPSAGDASGAAWHSSAIFISDNVGTQIDGLGHVTRGEDNHWYNGFAEAVAGGDFGIRRCEAAGIPPVILSAVLIDVAGWKGLEQLPSGYAIGPDDLRRALEAQGTEIRPGDAVLIRTGVLRHWGQDGSNHEVLAKHDSAGITLAAAKWLVEEKGAAFIGADTTGLEVAPAPEGSTSFIPVHLYLLVEQGVHIGELHYLEDLARDRAYRFCYIALVNKIRGAVAGFTLRPVGML